MGDAPCCTPAVAPAPGHPWTEFKNSTFDNHLGEKGTKRELTVHDNHEQFGVPERFSRTKPELERAMLIDAGLP